MQHFSGEKWDAKRVKKAIVEALKVERAMPSGWSRGGSSWPEYELEYPRVKTRWIATPSPIQISHMEIVLLGYRGRDGIEHRAWLNGAIIGYPEHRRVLAVWSKWASGGKIGRDRQRETEREFCHRVGHPLSTMKALRDGAAAIIAARLNIDRLPAW